MVTPAAKIDQEKRLKATNLLRLTRNSSFELSREVTVSPGMSRSSIYRHANIDEVGGRKRKAFSDAFKCNAVAEYAHTKDKQGLLEKLEIKPCYMSKWKS